MSTEERLAYVAKLVQTIDRAYGLRQPHGHVREVARTIATFEPHLRSSTPSESGET
jgi:hypothetical protein